MLMVLTYDGVHQWVIYLRDLAQFKAAVEAIPDRDEGYPIEVVADKDPHGRPLLRSTR